MTDSGHEEFVGLSELSKTTTRSKKEFEKEIRVQKIIDNVSSSEVSHCSHSMFNPLQQSQHLSPPRRSGDVVRYPEVSTIHPHQFYPYTNDAESPMYNTMTGASSYATHTPTYSQTRHEHRFYTQDHESQPSSSWGTNQVAKIPLNNEAKQEKIPPSRIVVNEYRPGRDHIEISQYYPPSHRGRNLSNVVRQKDDQHRDTSISSSSHSYEMLFLENQRLRQQLKDSNNRVSSFQQQVIDLEGQINELRQLPTAKISHIPIEEMIKIMQEYGSEVSNQTMTIKRKTNIKKASIIRQFRRWNPEFFRFFVYMDGEWVPRLGREGELERRAKKRTMMKQQSRTSTL